MNTVSFIILFVVLQLINVILNTLKSILTVNGTKIQSAIINAITFAVYTVVVIFTASDFGYGAVIDTVIKVIITAVTNFIGVYIANWLLEFFRKDRLWEIVATVDYNKAPDKQLAEKLMVGSISFNITKTNRDNVFVFHIYSHTQKESVVIKNLLQEYNAKYFVHEEKVKL